MFARALRFSSLAVLALLMAGAVQAQSTPDPDRQAAAKDLMAAMNAPEQFHKTLSSVQNLLAQQMKTQPAGEKAIALIAKIFDPESPDVKTYLADAENALLTFYAEHFTTDELKEIAAFQRSAAGKKLQASIPEMVGSLGPPLAKFQEGVKTKLVEELSAKPKQ
jgi:uncharacterized protein